MKNLFLYLAIFLAAINLIIGSFFILINIKPKITSEPAKEVRKIAEKSVSPEADVDESQRPAAISPEIIKAVYATSWSASKENFIEYLIDLANATEINAVVLDVKDYSGYVAYDIALLEVERYGAKQIRIRDIDSLIDRLHEQGIYVVARISVFQDPMLARARPDLAVHSKSKLGLEAPPSLSLSSLWKDHMGLAWIDPAARDAWKYNVAIAKDASSRGFDELNFDYVRFPSDGNLQDMSYPFWKETDSKHKIIREFFKYLRQEIPNMKISVDLFGLSTASSNDLGIGQIIEDAYEYFDYVCPMVYPSHYESGFLGYEEPAEYPYQVVKYSMDSAFKKLADYKKFRENKAKLRPWLQDFNLGAEYSAEMVKAEIKAVQDSAGENFTGFLLWNSENIYTKEALQSEKSE